MDTPPCSRPASALSVSRSATPQPHDGPFALDGSSEGSEPDHAASLTQLCLDAFQQAAGGPLSEGSQARALGAISAMDECLTGTQLNLMWFMETDLDSFCSDDQKSLTSAQPGTGLRLRWADLVAFAPEAWTALNEYVLQQNGTGITKVTLPPQVDPRALLTSLSRLPDLQHVHIMLPPGQGTGTLDLGQLQPSHPGRLFIEIEGPVSDLTIHAPAGSEVRANVPDVALHKSRVLYVDGKGQQIGAPVTLAGAAYHHTTGSLLPQELNVRMQLNGESKFGSVTTSILEQSGDDILCRTLGTLWLMERHAHRQAKEQAPPDSKQAGKPFPYNTFQSTSDIQQRVTDDTIREEEALLYSTRPQALFDTNNFGAMISQQLRQMSPGETRSFAAITPNHMLGIELRVKEREHGGVMQREYVLNIYDPNETSTHRRVVAHDPAWFLDRTLGTWLPADAVNRYFPGTPKLGSLVRWVPPEQRTGPAPAAPSHQAGVHVDLKDTQTGKFLVVAASRGAADSISLGVGSILESEMDDDNKWRRLRADDLSGKPALQLACERSDPAAATAYLRALLACPPGALGHGYLLNLLAAPRDGVPTLEKMARVRPPSAPEASIHAYVREITASNLPLADKIRLLGARGDYGTPAQAALELSPERTAAMMCGILDAGLPDRDTLTLLEALGVDPDAVEKAMARVNASLAEHAGPTQQDQLKRQAAWNERLQKKIAEAISREKQDDKSPSTTGTGESGTTAPLPVIPPDPAEAPALAALRNALVPLASQAHLQRLAAGLDTSVAGAAAQALLGCLSPDGKTLDLYALPPRYRGLACALTPAAWQALQQHAVAKGGVGITRVLMPKPADGLADPVFIAEGLNEVKTLAQLEVPWQPVLEFGGLAHPPGQLKIVVDNRGFEDNDTQFVLPPGCQTQMMATGEGEVHTEYATPLGILHEDPLAVHTT